MDADCQGTHRTYRQRRGLYFKLFNLYLHFTNLPSLKLPICFTCKTYLEDFQKDRQLIKNKTFYSDCTACNFSLSTPFFVYRNCGLPRNRFFFIYMCHHASSRPPALRGGTQKKRLRGRLQNYSSENNDRKILHQIPTYL